MVNSQNIPTTSIFFSKNYLKRIIQYLKILKNRKYDIIHCHLEEASAIYLSFAMFLGIGTRIAQSHLTQSPRSSSGKYKKVLRPLLSIVTTEKFACGNDAFLHMWGDFRPQYIMTNAIEIEKYRYSESLSILKKKELRISLNMKIIGTIGRFCEQKNPYFIINIIKALKEMRDDFFFLWIGEGPMLREIKTLALEMDICNCIKFLGNRNDVNEILSSFDVFILPSLYEGLPIVGVEAQASGLPCIMSDTITKEVAISDNAYYLPLNNTQDWVNLICDRLDSKTNRANITDIENSKYNIHNAVGILKNMYLDFIKKII